MPRGILIALEGIDGAGKTTQLELLTAFLRQVGETVVASKEPTNGPWGQKIRSSAMTGRLSLDEELSAFIEDRKEHVRDLIEPALSLGKIVLLDRYFYSTIAYQGSRGGNTRELTATMRATAPEPDAVILLDVPVELGITRINRRDGKPNHFENLENLQAVRGAFLEVAAACGLTVIDGAGDERTVRRAIIDALIHGVFARRHQAKYWGCDEPSQCKPGTCRWTAMVDAARRL